MIELLCDDEAARMDCILRIAIQSGSIGFVFAISHFLQHLLLDLVKCYGSVDRHIAIFELTSSYSTTL